MTRHNFVPYLFVALLTLNACQKIGFNWSGEKSIGALSSGKQVVALKNDDQQWGIAIKSNDTVLWSQHHPLQVEYYPDSTLQARGKSGYDRIHCQKNKLRGNATLTLDNVAYVVEDSWEVSGNALLFSRRLKVNGEAPGGFLSSTELVTLGSRDAVRCFAPGMIYGDPSVISADAIGGIHSGNDLWIREDRLPAPLFGVYAENGRSLTLLNPAPQGHTTKEDSHDRRVRTLVDRRFRFGAMGTAFSGDSIRVGVKWPGTEGSTTYRGFFYPGGQVHRWRQRFHPVEDGFEQHYGFLFRFEEDASFQKYYSRAWRWAWDLLDPKVNRQDIQLARESLCGMLADQVETRKGITGLSNMITFEEGFSGERIVGPLGRTVMGFTGKALESANFLLQASDIQGNERAGEYRSKGNAIIQSFLRLKLNPPEGEGFYWQTGKPAPALPRNRPLYIRSFGDDLKALLKAAKREKSLDRDHPEWIAWVRSFADWLLPQQHPDGGFPRGWVPVTGEVADSSLQSTYNAIPFLVLLSDLTNDDKYLAAALRAGEFAWNNGQSEGIFVGGTIDNPNVVDKEAGTLSLEAYLSLHQATNDGKWLDRARVAAAFSETWIYAWDVPMPEDERDEDLHWKRGVPTTGLQLISTGHSLVDAYMAFDADEFARLFTLTGDDHYKQVAAILLHNTKGMLAVPGRSYDLPGPGWQQEHWSLAPERGLGRKKAWLPWVTTSHLNGIFGMEEACPDLFRELTGTIQ